MTTSHVDFTAFKYADFQPEAKPQATPLYADATDNPNLQKHFRVDGYKNPYCAGAFLLCLLGHIIVGCVGFSTMMKAPDAAASSSTATTLAPSAFTTTVTTRAPSTGSNTGSSSSTTSIDMSNLGFSALASLGISLVLVALVLLALKAFPAQFIWASLILVVILWVVVTIIGFVLGNVGFIVIGILFGLISAAWIACIRHKIPFSALLLETSTHCVMTYYGTVALAFLIVIPTIIFCAFFLGSLYQLITWVGNPGVILDIVVILWVYCYFWQKEVLADLVHVTTSGTMATWFFCGDAYSGQVVAAMPSNPSAASLKRATTTSFGAIALIAAGMAFIKTLEVIVKSAQSRSGGVGAAIGACLMACLRRIAEYISTYALVFVAIYGEDAFTSAKMTFDFFGKSLWSCIVNDIILDRLFGMLTFVCSMTVGVLCAVIFNGSFIAKVLYFFIAFLVCWVIFAVTLNTVESGTTALIVCFSLYPDVAHHTHPALNTKLNRAVSELMNGCCGGPNPEMMEKLAQAQAKSQAANSMQYAQPQYAQQQYAQQQYAQPVAYGQQQQQPMMMVQNTNYVAMPPAAAPAGYRNTKAQPVDL